MMMMALNAKTEKRWWLWTPKLRSDDDSECQNWEWWWLWTLELGSDDVFERRNWEVVMDLNVETEKRWWLWTSKLRSNNGSECQNWEWWQLWMPKLRMMMALIVETMKQWWLWTPRLKMQGENEWRICPSVACYYSSQSSEMVLKRLHESQMISANKSEWSNQL